MLNDFVHAMSMKKCMFFICSKGQHENDVSELNEVEENMQLDPKLQEDLNLENFDGVEKNLIKAPMVIQILAGLMLNSSKM